MSIVLKKAAVVLLLLSLLPGLYGCTPTHSNELIQEIEERNVPLGMAWLEEHLEGAENISCGAVSSDSSTLFSDVVNGTYEKDGNTCNYVLNVDTEEFATSEHYEDFRIYAAEYVKTLLAEDLVYDHVEVWPATETVKGQTVSDQNSTGQKKERIYGEAEAYGPYILHEYSEEELCERAEYAVDNRDLTVRIYMNDLDCVEPLFADLEYIRNHSRWVVYFIDSETDDYYINEKRQEGFVLVRYFKDENGKIRSEEIAKEE